MEDQAQKPANSVRSIFTRSKSNEGVKVDLKEFPGNNWIRVLGTDSDVVQEAILVFYRNEAVKDKSKSEAEKAARKAGHGGPFEDLGVIASMVAEWSFDEPMTPELLQEALTEVPSMRVAIVNAALERANFLPPSVSPSSSTPQPNSD